ncbi:MAG: toluene tolerance protein, partial [Desulfobacula sp.]|nr:toluene tolerance protein [Desulfobacula sp.]
MKRIFSSALIWPYAKRFIRAVQILQKKDIPTVQVINTYKVPSIKRDLIIYQPLEGQSLRDLMDDKNYRKKLVLQFASFLAHLHNSGIYFRAMHFNNVIVTSQGEFGLIDVTDFFYSSGPLNRFKRVRNFKPILHYKEDRQAIASVSVELFLDKYVEKA